jgi:hypothetical protein
LAFLEKDITLVLLILNFIELAMHQLCIHLISDCSTFDDDDDGDDNSIQSNFFLCGNLTAQRATTKRALVEKKQTYANKKAIKY